MADAKAVYEQFLLTPLKLKPQRREDEAEADGVADALGFDLASETDEEEREGGKRDDKQRQPPVHASPELERLRGRIKSADLSGDERSATSKARPTRRRGSVRQDAKSATSAGAAPVVDTRKRAQKKKRVTRSVAIPSARTGGEWVDTPSKASRPPKRSRRQATSAETDKENRGEATDSAAADAALSLLSRRISDSFEDMSDGEASEHAEQEDSTVTSSTSLSSPPPLVAASCSSSKEATTSVRSTTTRSVRRSRRLARQFSDQEDAASSPPPPPAVDALTPLCDALIATNTISGLLFALSLNALRSLGHSVEHSAPDSSLEAASTADLTPAAATNPFQGVYNICRSIAQCEQLTQQQFKLPTVHLSPKRRHDASARALEKVLATTHAAAKSPVKTKTTKKKKSVRFRSFDFSCLSLQYVENEHVAAMVDHMIASYGKLMDYVPSTLKQSEHGAATSQATTINMLRELAGVMASEAQLLHPVTRSDATHDIDEAGISDQESAEAARIVEVAFSSRDSMTQHEIRVAGVYFAQQFERLVSSAYPATSSSPPSRPVAFLHEMFSALISSAVRYKLRLIFLHSTSKEEERTQVEEESKADGCLTAADTSPAALAAATYAHQDVGAAIHRALQESLLYLPLVSPMLALLDDEHGDDHVNAVVDQLKQRSVDDVERVDQFILARRFLRYHLTRALDPQTPSSEFTSGVWREVERVCSIAQRFHFEDEAHLFPLASVQALNDSLASEDARLERLDRAVQAFWEAQDGYEASRANGLQECAECRGVISRAEASVSIACTLCASRFHLKCLHLPDSFAQFAAHYTCPACFLGRSRMEY